MLKKTFIITAFIPLLSSCAMAATPQQQTTFITLDGEQITKEELGKYTMWNCTDRVYKKDTLLSIGISHDFKDLGFILYENKMSGDSTAYAREGLNQRWDWGKYSFILKPDGTGSYYDFTFVKSGETTKPDSWYYCYKV